MCAYKLYALSIKYRKGQKVPWEEGTYRHHHEEFDGQYDEIDIHFVGPYPYMATDPDEIIIDENKRKTNRSIYNCAPSS